MARLAYARGIACAGLWALATMAGLAQSALAAPKTAALMPFEIIVEDTLEGIPIASKAERDRLELMTRALAELLRASGEYALADTAPLAAEIEKQSPFFKCNGCEADIAKKLGAAYAITGLVQKGSASAANISVAIRDVATGELVRTAGITVLEASDEGWVRGVKRLTRNRLISGEAAK